jgi:hypothetical protein
VRDLCGEAEPSIGQLRVFKDLGDHNFWATAAIQPLDVGIGSYMHAAHACRASKAQVRQGIEGR